jgi:prophage regulatory protein
MSITTEQPYPSPKPRRLISKRVVLERVPWGQTKLWEEVDAGRFPQPVALGGKRIAWHESEVDDWIANLPRAPRVNPTLEKARAARAAYREQAAA